MNSSESFKLAEEEQDIGLATYFMTRAMYLLLYELKEEAKEVENGS